LKCETIEQGSVAESIRSFPRGKLVFDQPLELPAVGKLWLKESSKEELLANWLRIVRQERLTIHSQTRMLSIEREANGDLVVVTAPATDDAVASATAKRTRRRARRVLLAIGRRGTPRKLDVVVEGAVESRVHYSLADARSFEGQRVVVVGLGDVAMEAAIALGRQPGTTVTVIHRGGGFTRGASRNITEMKRMIGAGRLAVSFGSEITRIDERRLHLKSGGASRAVDFDAVLVLIGSIPPLSTLRAAGVKTFGDLTDPSESGAVKAEAPP
jgi:thioredoxin reductase